MLVTDVEDKMCSWQLWDVGDGSGRFQTNIQKMSSTSKFIHRHPRIVTNITAPGFLISILKTYLDHNVNPICQKLSEFIVVQRSVIILVNERPVSRKINEHEIIWRDGVCWEFFLCKIGFSEFHHFTFRYHSIAVIVEIFECDWLGRLYSFL